MGLPKGSHTHWSAGVSFGNLPIPTPASRKVTELSSEEGKAWVNGAAEAGSGDAMGQAAEAPMATAAAQAAAVGTRGTEAASIGGCRRQDLDQSDTRLASPGASEPWDATGTCTGETDLSLLPLAAAATRPVNELPRAFHLTPPPAPPGGRSSLRPEDVAAILSGQFPPPRASISLAFLRAPRPLPGADWAFGTPAGVPFAFDNDVMPGVEGFDSHEALRKLRRVDGLARTRRQRLHRAAGLSSTSAAAAGGHSERAADHRQDDGSEEHEHSSEGSTDTDIDPPTNTAALPVVRNTGFGEDCDGEVAAYAGGSGVAGVHTGPAFVKQTELLFREHTRGVEAIRRRTERRQRRALRRAAMAKAKLASKSEKEAATAAAHGAERGLRSGAALALQKQAEAAAEEATQLRMEAEALGDDVSDSSASSPDSVGSGFRDWWKSGGRRHARPAKLGSAPGQRSEAGPTDRAAAQDGAARGRGSDEDSRDGADAATDASSGAESEASVLTIAAPEEEEEFGGDLDRVLTEYTLLIPAELHSARMTRGLASEPDDYDMDTEQGHQDEAEGGDSADQGNGAIDDADADEEDGGDAGAWSKPGTGSDPDAAEMEKVQVPGAAAKTAAKAAAKTVEAPGWFFADTLEELEQALFPPGPPLADVFYKPNSLNAIVRLPVDHSTLLPKPIVVVLRVAQAGATVAGAEPASVGAAKVGSLDLHVRPQRHQFHQSHQYYRKPDWRLRGGKVVDMNSPEEAAKRRAGRRHAMPLVTRTQFNLQKAELIKVLEDFSGPYGPVAELEAAVAFPDCPCDVVAERLQTRVRSLTAYRSRKRKGALVWGPLPQSVTAGLADKREYEAWMADQEQKEKAGGGVSAALAERSEAAKLWAAEKKRRKAARRRARRDAIQEVQEQLRLARQEARAHGLDEQAAIAGAMAGADLDRLNELDFDPTDVSQELIGGINMRIACLSMRVNRLPFWLPHRSQRHRHLQMQCWNALKRSSARSRQLQRTRLWGSFPARRMTLAPRSSGPVKTPNRTGSECCVVGVMGRVVTCPCVSGPALWWNSAH